MGLIEKDLAIIAVEDLLDLNLAIPLYQRPYSWKNASTNILFMDTYEAYQQGVEEYRLGAVILHKDRQFYNIVDGQQRLTTLAILLYCLGEEGCGLLNEQYSTLSTHAIKNTYEVLSRKVAQLKEVERTAYKNYVLEKCTFVKIVTDQEQEAFQFFDSQNARGKELAPHDLLKSYHLREMHTEDELMKTKLISSWENKDQDALEALFKSYLFPVTQWYKCKSGLDYSSEKIGAFKGIKSTNTYNYAIYQKAANLFVEQMNTNGGVELLGTKTLNQFQLTQPLIAGKRFFHYTLHYADLLEKIQKKIDFFHKDKEEVPEKRSGDIYILQLYQAVLLFFVDRFGMAALTDSVMQQLYTWAYSLRLVMHAVYPQTINKYASGQHERINKEVDLFARISEMTDPEELNLILFEQLEETQLTNGKEKYPKIVAFLRKANRW